MFVVWRPSLSVVRKNIPSFTVFPLVAVVTLTGVFHIVCIFLSLDEFFVVDMSPDTCPSSIYQVIGKLWAYG